MNLVLDCNDRLNRKVVLLASGACYIAEEADNLPSPYRVVHSMVVLDIINFMLSNQLGKANVEKALRMRQFEELREVQG